MNQVYIEKGYKQNFFIIGFDHERTRDVFLEKIKQGLIFENKKL